MKRFIFTLLIILCFGRSSESMAGTYTTKFPLTENPISEGGNWINGQTVGLDWSNISTTPGLAIGHEAGGVNYSDATALLTGSWGADQTAQATVYVGLAYDSDYPEVELRLRSSLSAHNNSGYEISFKATKTGSAYLIIVKWNGPFGSFNILSESDGATYGVANGDVVKATIVGNTITAYINGVQKAQVTDNTFTTGNPGMGFNFHCSTTCQGTNNGYGYSSFTASDGSSQPPTILFNEPFDDANFSSRGWFDSTGGAIDTTVKQVGAGAFRCSIATGAQGCTNGGPGRHDFTPTNSVYVSYWVNYSANYAIGGHQFYILTNRDVTPSNQYPGLSRDYLDVYLQSAFNSSTDGVQQVQIQDGNMIDEANINVNLIGVTENRAVAACNGIGNTGGVTVFSIFGGPSCYVGGSPTPTSHWNQYIWNTPSISFSSAQGANYKNSWHFIESYVQLNSIVGGIGQNDGIIKTWIDHNLLINQTNVIMRTGANPTMQFNQLVLGPYIGSGSPVASALWIDDLTVGTAPPDTTTPSAPQNLQVR